MSKLLSYYKLLDVDERASAEELKRVYRTQALKYHPDTNQSDSDSAAMFLLIKNAYDSLSDVATRAEVDSFARPRGKRTNEHLGHFLKVGLFWHSMAKPAGGRIRRG
jgi:DnaJ-class molecular chaperone